MIYVFAVYCFVQIVLAVVYGILLSKTKKKIQKTYKIEQNLFETRRDRLGSLTKAYYDARYLPQYAGNLDHFLHNTIVNKTSYMNVSVEKDKVVFWTYLPLTALVCPPVLYYLFAAGLTEMREYIKLHRLDEREVPYSVLFTFSTSRATQHYINKAADEALRDLNRMSIPEVLGTLHPVKPEETPSLGESGLFDIRGYYKNFIKKISKPFTNTEKKAANGEEFVVDTNSNELMSNGKKFDTKKIESWKENPLMYRFVNPEPSFLPKEDNATYLRVDNKVVKVDEILASQNSTFPEAGIVTYHQADDKLIEAVKPESKNE
jgi:hypothetical protein